MLPLDGPLVIVNYKAYPSALGRRSVELTQALARAAQGKRVILAVAPQAADVHRVAQANLLPVLAQHVDSLPPGNGTGSTMVESVAEAGAVGSLVNHAEKRLTLAEVGAVVARLRAARLTSVVCTDTAATTRAAAALRPDVVAVEPPELIGGTVSVTSADPGIVRDAVKVASEVHPGVRVLCGAGVQSSEDLAAALKLGAHGILLASAVMKAKDPGQALSSLLAGLP